MRSLSIRHTLQASAARQRGVVLFFALIALLAMSLAAVALVRSVDTSTIIAGNLALKQSATTSSDGGAEAAITFLNNMAINNAGTTPVTNAAHAFNQDAPAVGYYASYNPLLDLTDPLLWQPANSAAALDDGSGNALPDSSGNRVRYIIQRMCRTPGVIIPNAKCLFGVSPPEGEKEEIKRPQDWCDLTSPGCPAPGQTPLLRITAQTTGLKGTISYVQVIVY